MFSEGLSVGGKAASQLWPGKTNNVLGNTKCQRFFCQRATFLLLLLGNMASESLVLLPYQTAEDSRVHRQIHSLPLQTWSRLHACWAGFWFDLSLVLPWADSVESLEGGGGCRCSAGLLSCHAGLPMVVQVWQRWEKRGLRPSTHPDSLVFNRMIQVTGCNGLLAGQRSELFYTVKDRRSVLAGVSLLLCVGITNF